MKTVYFVTEGKTDKIVIEGLISTWLGEEDFLARHVQPPSSEYAEDLDSNLSEGWKGVVAWCQGVRAAGPAGRDEAIKQADCLFIHIDGDVAFDAEFKAPPLLAGAQNAQAQCDHVRAHLISLLPAPLPENIVLCVPSHDTEAWVLTALHPDVSDQHIPIELRPQPASLLVNRKPHKLVRNKDGKLKKLTERYVDALHRIVSGWNHCVEGDAPRCPEAVRFEAEAKAALQ